MKVDFILDRFERSPKAKLFCLVCGLQYERLYDEEIIFLHNMTSPLFRTFTDAKIAWAGPWLIDVTNNENLINKLAVLEMSAPSVSWLISDTPIDNLAIHLASLMNVTLPSGKNALFRFYDPRVMKNIPTLLDEEQMKIAMKPIIEWYYLSNGYYHPFHGGLLP
ncbi:DUF4123 domain-containing protein [Proteus mirabilis]|uniref:DUF4123 domain-containing protein n=1 Tax=Proteus mirabilis TaxID=584 RepID=UPI0029E1A121|nr:DUF4123 domain-containing protein [Proteus mirabilis]HEJ9436504.1 DUF4123 domain-containing protein [Proteus mirabilis]